MASTQEVEMLRRQLDELTAQMIEMRPQSSNTAMNAAVTGLTEAVRTVVQSVSKPRPEDTSRKARAVRTWQRTLHSRDTRVRSILPIQPC